MTITEFEEKAEKIHLLCGENPQMLFHYRKQRHVKDILRKNELRFASFKGLLIEADKKELVLGHERILFCIKEKLEKNAQYFWYFLSKEFEKILSSMSVYILSLSSEKDDKMLWDEYADNGKGVAFGFSFHEMVIFENGTKIKNPKYSIKVFYEKEVEAFDKFINQFLDLAEQYLKKIPSTMHHDLAISLASHLIVYLPALKRDKFDFEREHRIVMPGIIGKDGKRYPNEISSEYLVDYKEHKSYHFLHNFILEELREIVIGFNVDENFENEIKNFLVKSRYNPERIIISKSTVA
ncbi:MAG: DUF2971 domain-containing protein [Proteobacteria bacterium]|nr:DUF2971 domain-containing protein [Pseudomonadota bacterium]